MELLANFLAEIPGADKPLVLLPGLLRHDAFLQNEVLAVVSRSGHEYNWIQSCEHIDFPFNPRSAKCISFHCAGLFLVGSGRCEWGIPGGSQLTALRQKTIHVIRGW